MAANTRISINSAILMALSAVIGSTVFVITGVPIFFAGFLTIPLFLVVGFFAVVFASEFGELSSDMPDEKGVAYSYVNRSFGSELGLISGILLYTAYCSTISAIGLSFGSYVSQIIGVASAATPLAIFIIAAMAIASSIGMKKTAWLNYLLILFTIGVIALFIGFALTKTAGHGFPITNFHNSTEQNSASSIFYAATIMVFAFAGFQTITSFTKDIFNKGRGAAKAMITAVLISTLVYALVAFSLILLVPAQSFSSSANPFSFALDFAGAPHILTYIVSVGAAVAIAAAILVITITASRLIYQIAKDGLLPEFFRLYDKKKDVAKTGILTTAVAAIILLFSGNIYIIASISNFGMLFSWLMASFTLISRRRRGRKPSFTVPLYPILPAVAILVSLVFMAGMPRETLTVGIILILLLIIVYYFIIEFKQRRIMRIRLFK